MYYRNGVLRETRLCIVGIISIETRLCIIEIGIKKDEAEYCRNGKRHKAVIYQSWFAFSADHPPQPMHYAADNWWVVVAVLGWFECCVIVSTVLSSYKYTPLTTIKMTTKLQIQTRKTVSHPISPSVIMKLFTVLLLSLVGLSAAMPGPGSGLEKVCLYLLMILVHITDDT